MDHHLTTRRAFLKRAPAVGVALVVAPVAAIASEPLTLKALAERFGDDAKALDPTIKKVWFGTNELTAESRGSIFSIVLDRGTDAAPKSPKPKPSRTARAIKAHRKAWQEFGDSVNAADDLHPDYGGPEAVARWYRLSANEERQFNRLLSLPATGADARDRAAYVYDMLRRNQTHLSHEQTVLLLRSSAGIL